MYPASIQFTNDSFIKNIHVGYMYTQEYIAEDFNENTIAVTGSRRVCGCPVMTRSTDLCLNTCRAYRPIHYWPGRQRLREKHLTAKGVRSPKRLGIAVPSSPQALLLRAPLAFRSNFVDFH